MKDIFKIIAFSILGGIITLSGYLLFIKNPQQIITQHHQQIPQAVPVNLPIENINFNDIATVNFTDAAEKTVHSVVHITNTSTYLQPTSAFDYYNRSGKQIQKGSTGSGVIITGDGYIVSNYHVIKGADELTVTLNNQKTYKARVIGFDAKNDISVLKIDATEKLSYIPFGDSDAVKIGEWVLAVGNPYNLTSTVTAGIVSAKSRDLGGDNNIQSFIQTDAAVNPGNSGGALVNTKGELIGINTAISSKTGSYIGYAFAVPSNITKKIIDDILQYGTVQQAVLGVSGVGLNNNVAKHYNVSETEGYYISNIEKNSGAEKGALLVGDIIKKIDDIDIKKSSDLTGYLSAKAPKSIVEVLVLRKGVLKTLSVQLSDTSILTKKAFELTLKNLTKQEKNDFEIKSGVKVTQNRSAFLADKLGVTKGCVITQINEKPIECIADLDVLASLSLQKLYNIEVVYPSGKSKNWWLR